VEGDPDPLVFQDSCLLEYDAPDVVTIYEVTLRCASEPSCIDSDVVGVWVLPAPCETDCDNGVDDDGDGFVDCADIDCCWTAPCRGLGEVDCANGVDEDCDGLADCEDDDCACELSLCPSLDCDEDGTANASDCDSADPEVWLVPMDPELRLSKLDPAGLSLSWTDTWQPAGDAGFFDVAVDALDALHADGEAIAPCLFRELFSPRLNIPAPANGSLYLLVRSRNDCTPDPSGWGFDSAGAERPACP
jgi:hypothetical protein